MKRANKFIWLKLLLLSTLFLSNYSMAEESNWRTKTIPQAYIQNYIGSDSRKYTLNIGAYLVREYLDSDKFELGIFNTTTYLNSSASLSENLLYLSAQHHEFLDTAPGKLTLRMDAYSGVSTLKYNIATPPGSVGAGGMGNSGKKSGSSAIINESTNMSAFQPQIAYSNYARTFYADLGYANSKYSGTSTTKVQQLTPTLAFGWNDSYEWLQFRGYFINVDDSVSANLSKKFASAEVKYTYWLKNISANKIENIMFSALLGERLLAIDPDARAVYSNADIQKGSLSASVQWKLSESEKILTLVNLGRYSNPNSADDYNSLLIYANYQYQW